MPIQFIIGQTSMFGFLDSSLNNQPPNKCAKSSYDWIN